MDELARALTDISAIRTQIARGAEFRGYGPATVALTGGLALLASAAQRALVVDPLHHILSYLAIWLSTAIVAIVLIGIEVITRSRRVHSGLAPEMLWTTVEQFLPAAVAGMLVASVIIRLAPETVWMIPGLWQTFFSLGVFAACRCLPRQLCAVGFWYLMSGLICLAIANGKAALSPWAMGLPYGGGQLLAAVLFRFTSPKVYGEI